MPSSLAPQVLSWQLVLGTRAVRRQLVQVRIDILHVLLHLAHNVGHTAQGAGASESAKGSCLGAWVFQAVDEVVALRASEISHTRFQGQPRLLLATTTLPSKTEGNQTQSSIFNYTSTEILQISLR